MAQWAPQRADGTAICESSNDGYNKNKQAMYIVEVESSDNESKAKSNDGKPEKKKRVPKCHRCKNHNVHVKIKDHKDVCPNRFCICVECIKTSIRQRDMQKQTAIRRKFARYKKLMKKQHKIILTELPALTLNEIDVKGSTRRRMNDKPTASNVKRAINDAKTTSLASAPAAQNPELPFALNLSAPDNEDIKPNINVKNFSETEQIESLVEYSSRIIKRFGYPWEALSLIYTILKDSKKDVKLASKRIMEDVTFGRSLLKKKALNYFNFQHFKLTFVN